MTINSFSNDDVRDSKGHLLRRVYWRRWYKKHIKRLRKKNRLWHLQPRVKKERRDRERKLKINILSHYGPRGKLRCSWKDCGIVDVDMLTLDHVYNDGARDFRGATGRKRGGMRFYMYLRRNNFPAGLRTLCHNHQWKKEIRRRRTN